MYRLCFLLIGLLIFEGVNSSALPEIQNKNDKGSNDKIPTNNKDSKDPSEKIESRKRYNNKKTSDDEASDSLESVVLAIDTGVKKLMEGKSKPDIVDAIAKVIVDFAKTADPIYRAKGQAYDIKPEIFHFRSDKPSVMFELNSKSIINVLKDVLQSKVVHKYLDKFSKEAAVIYRAVKKEMDKKQPQAEPHHRLQ